MKPQIFLVGALVLALVPGALLISGCGGGSGSGTSSAPNLRFSRQSNVEFPDSPEITGVLTVNFVDTAPNVNARASGTLQLFSTPKDSATPQPFPDSPPNAVDFFSVLPGNATYILVGNVVPTNAAATDIALDLRGSYEDSPPFTLRGNFVKNAIVTLEAKFNRGDSVLRGRIINVNNATVPGGTAPTARPTTTATSPGTTTTGATTNGATTNGATTNGATTTGATTNGATTNGGATSGLTTTGGATAGLTTTGATTMGATTVGLPPSLP